MQYLVVGFVNTEHDRRLPPDAFVTAIGDQLEEAISNARGLAELEARNRFRNGWESIPAVDLYLIRPEGVYTLHTRLHFPAARFQKELQEAKATARQIPE